MPVASIACPMTPPRASISRTICPLATPPIAGLQLIWATVSQFVVSSPTRQPIRAAAHAAFVATDVTSEQSARAAIELAIQRFGALHGVVSCAGILGAARIVGREGPHDLALFQKVIQVNLVGTFNMLRLAAMAMSRNSP